jgi:hypothetical protein
MIQRESLVFEVGRQGGQVFGHVAVDIDDGVGQLSVDLGG